MNATERTRHVAAIIMAASTLALSSALASCADNALLANVKSAVANMGSVPVTGFSLDKSSATIIKSVPLALVATVEPANATGATVTWTSGDAAIATVSDTGLVTGTGIGSTTITATCSGFTAQCAITVDRTITTFAGTMGVSGSSGDGYPATGALLNNPQGMAIDTSGSIYIADIANLKIRKVDATGKITTHVDVPFKPRDVAVDSSYIYIVAYTVNTGTTTGTGAGYAYRVALAGTSLETLASGLVKPNGIDVDNSGNVYVTQDSTSVSDIIKIDTNNGNTVTTIPTGMGSAYDVALNNDYTTLYIAYPASNRIMKIPTSGGSLTAVAGTGSAGFSGDNGLAINAELSYPFGIATGAEGSVYIADTVNKCIRCISTSGIISTIAGNPPNGSNDPSVCGNGIAALDAFFESPYAVMVSGTTFYIAEETFHCIRKVE